MSIKSEEEKLEDAMENYKNVRECLTGLFDIMEINFSKTDIFHEAGMENLEMLHMYVLDILKSAFVPREVRIRLREIESDQKDTKEIFPF
ncbi:MAG: hypothetical protein ACXABO_14325 [Promethearchaeota archaeon]|jgi:hypothetical protein